MELPGPFAPSFRPATKILPSRFGPASPDWISVQMRFFFLKGRPYNRHFNRVEVPAKKGVGCGWYGDEVSSCAVRILIAACR